MPCGVAAGTRSASNKNDSYHYLDIRRYKTNATPAKITLGIHTDSMGLSVDLAEKVVDNCMNMM